MNKQLRNALWKVQNAYPGATFRRYGKQWRLEVEGRAVSGVFNTMDDALYDAAFPLPGPYTPPARRAVPRLFRIWQAFAFRRSEKKSPLPEEQGL